MFLKVKVLGAHGGELLNGGCRLAGRDAGIEQARTPNRFFKEGVIR